MRCDSLRCWLGVAGAESLCPNQPPSVYRWWWWSPCLPGEKHRCGEFSYFQIIIWSAFQTCNLWRRKIKRVLRDERVGIQNLFQLLHSIFMFLPFILHWGLERGRHLFKVKPTSKDKTWVFLLLALGLCLTPPPPKRSPQKMAGFILCLYFYLTGWEIFRTPNLQVTPPWWRIQHNATFIIELIRAVPTVWKSFFLDKWCISFISHDLLALFQYY